MTQPDSYSIPVDLDTSGVVSGAQQGEEAVGALQAALAGLTIGAVAAGAGLNKVSSSAGHNLFGTGSLQAARDFQQAMSGLAAISAVTGQSLTGFQRTVQGLSRALPGGTAQAIQTVSAVQALGLAAKNQQPQIAALSTEFTKLGAAVGESAPQMATQFGQLNRELANLDPSRLARFADVLTTLHATSGASASSIIGFSQAIGPVSQAAGLGESAILGISTAFTKLGDDGGAAATAVNKILTDLNSSVREGSNSMVAYANATGMTIAQFRKLFEANPAQALTKVTQALGNAGPQAPYLLQTLGLDPTRTQRALLELSQSGGLQAQIQTAVGAYGNGSTNKASAAAFNNLNDQLQRAASTTSQFGEALGAPLLKPLEMATRALNDFLGPIAAFANSPAGQIGATALLGGIGVAKFGGVALRGASALSNTALGYGAVTSSPIAALLGGRRAGRYGVDNAAYDPSTWAGRRYNGVINAGIAGEAMGAPILHSTNQRLFDLSQGFFGGRGGAAAQAVQAEAIAGDMPGVSPLRRVMRAAVGGAGLGMGGYLHLAAAPMSLATQDAQNRHFTMTQAGGPTRGLMDALANGGWKDPKATGAALSTFTKEISDTSLVVPRLKSSLMEYSTALLGFGTQAGVGAAKVGGNLLGKAGGAAAGFAMDNPALLLAAVGISAYELNKGANAYNQQNAASYQNQDIYGTLNQFRDAMGQAGIATQTMAQQIQSASNAIAQTVVTHSRAVQLSPSDIQAFGAPNKSKVVTPFTGTTSQVSAQIRGLNLAGLNPSDLQGVKQSLYNQGYNTQQIDAILAQVPATGSGNLSGNDITQMLAHVDANAETNVGGLHFLTSLNTLKGDVTGTLQSPSLQWKKLGLAGGGHPQLTSSGSQTLHELVGDVGQGYSANLAAGKGQRYSQQTALSTASQIMQAALATHDAATVVATEQALTAALSNKKTGITGMSAQEISQQSLAQLLQSHGYTVQGASIASLGGPIQAGHITPYGITALQGRARSIFGQFYGQGTSGVQGMVSTAVNQPENAGQVSKTALAVVAALVSSGTTLNSITAAAARSLNTTSGGQLAVQQAVLAAAQYQQQTAQIGMGQAGVIGSNINQAAGLLSANGTNSQAQFQQGQQLAQQTEQQVTSYYQQRIMAQYNYQIQAERSQQDFNIQTQRADQDFHIQSLRNLQDFNLSIKRSIQDAEASGYYNPYQRIDSTPVFSAGETESNLALQNTALIQQKKNLQTVRNEGLSGSAIQVLGLAQTANAQQLQQYVDDFANDPNVIKVINAEIAKRGTATKSLFLDQGNTTYQRQKQDYDIQTGRLQADFKLQQSRAQADFTLSMTRMAQDLHTQDLEVTGNMNDLQKDMIKILHGQTVDWKTQLINTMTTTIGVIRDKGSELKKELSASVGAASRIPADPRSGSATASDSGPALTSTPTGLHREGAGGGVNAGFLLSSESRPGTDTNSFGNPNLHWGKNVSIAPKKKHLSANALLAQKIAGPWGKGAEWDALYQIWEQESGFGTTAGEAAPGHAYGIPQAYWSSKPGAGAPMQSEGGDWRTNPRTQINWGLSYIQDRYGDPLGAWAHKSRTGWYANGGVAMGPQTMVIGEGSSPELALPLNQRGANFLITTLRQYIGSDMAKQITSGGQAMAVTINRQTYHYDSRTQYNGPMSFELTDPTKLGLQLAKTKRQQALTATKGGPLRR